MVVVVVVAVGVMLLVMKPYLTTWFTPGKTITADFARNYQLVPNETKVESAGLAVGVVSGLDCQPDGPCHVSLKVDKDALNALGKAPSAAIVPNTVLGGSYSVELNRGGATGAFTGDSIPVARTSVPVELDRVLDALPQPTRKSLQGVVGNTDDTLAGGGKDALRNLVADAPGTLPAATDLLTGLQGTQPDTDLPSLVTNLESIASTLTEHDGQLSSIVADLHTTTGVLAAQSRPLADAVGQLPATLRATRTGVTDLHTTLDQLAATADSFRPAAQQLAPLLQHLNPVLQEANPLLTELRPVLADLQPTVEQLVPVAQQGTHILQDVSGPVLDRVNGPIVHTVNSTWQGSGPYKDSGGGFQADHKFYEELGYLVTDFDRASETQDAQGSLLSFQVGAGTTTIGGVPLTLPNLLDQLTKAAGGAK
jgi:phospholipid/cholesterol/gamma-HCH transport system substrate-binding protein